MSTVVEGGQQGEGRKKLKRSRAEEKKSIEKTRSADPPESRGPWTATAADEGNGSASKSPEGNGFRDIRILQRRSC